MVITNNLKSIDKIDLLPIPCTRSIQVTKFVCIIKTERFVSVKPYRCYLTKPTLTTASIVGSTATYSVLRNVLLE